MSRQVSDEQQPLLETTIGEYLTGAQLATDMTWPNVSTKDTLQPLAYNLIREQTGLSSQHAILATHQAAEAITGCLEQKDKGLKASKPTFTSPTITYDSWTMTLFDNHTVSLTTVGSRIRCPLALPQDEDGDQWQFLNDEWWELTESTLTARDGTYFLHMGVQRHKTDAERTAEQRTAENGTVLGVDLGVENIVVTSTGPFVSGRRTHPLVDRIRTAACVTPTMRGAMGARKHAVGRPERGRSVHDPRSRGGEHDSRRGMRERLYAYRLRGLGRYSGAPARRDVAPPLGVPEDHRYCDVQGHIDRYPRRAGEPATHVSRCSHTDCGFTHEDNRPKTNGQDEFRCLKCGYEIHADYNAAKNIAVKCTTNFHRSHTSSGGGAPVDVRLNSGLLTVDGRGTVVPR